MEDAAASLRPTTETAEAVHTTDGAIRHLVIQLEEDDDSLPSYPAHQKAPESAEPRLTEFLPDPGYFLAGAISGGVSRTATAPLDRLKVYLLVNTQPGANAAVDAAKKGSFAKVLKYSGKPISDAIMSLWKAGGFRTFFAGIVAPSTPPSRLTLLSFLALSFSFAHSSKGCADQFVGNGLNVVKIMPETAIRVSKGDE